MIKGFENPRSAFRGAPFWAWNGALAPDELRRLMGMGGFGMAA